jgi:hypothetical protein
MHLYAPPWGVRAVAAVAAVLVAVAVARALRERPAARLRRQSGALLLRLGAMACLVYLLLNPTALLPQEAEGKPTLTILVDTSASMATVDADGTSRLEAAQSILGAAHERLSDAFVLDVRAFDRELRPADLRRLEADGKASDIGAAISTAVSDQAERKAQAGVLVVTDGRATTRGAEDAARLALARSVPLWTWCLGGEVPRRDLWLEVLAADALAFAGAEVELAATLHQVGYPQRSFRVQLLKDGKEVRTVEAVPGPDGSARVSAVVTAPESGEHRYVFRVPPEGDEADATNNERAVFLRVVGDKVRILVAEGEPHWDTKFLVQCLKRDERADLTAVYRLGEERTFAVLSSLGRQRRRAEDLFPHTAKEMMAYDVIVLGRGCEAFFDAQTAKLLTEFVSRRGGGLVFARGKAYGGRFAALAKFEPLVWGGDVEHDVRPRLTDAGRDSPVFEIGASGDVEELLGRLPALDQAATTTGEKPLAAVLATADGQSDRTILLAYQRYGQGKVLTLNASGLWRWAFREKTREEEEHVYARFWSAVVRWMLAGSDFLPGADVALRTARRYYTDEQTLRFLITTRGLDRGAYRPRLVIAGGGEPVAVEPSGTRGGAYIAEAGPFAPGTYQVTLQNNVGTPSEIATKIEVVSASVEHRVLSADRATMERLAETSQGKVLAGGDVARLPAIVEQWRAARQVGSRKSTLWDRWWLLGAILGALGLEWFVRRREGLL